MITTIAMAWRMASSTMGEACLAGMTIVIGGRSTGF